MCGIAGILLANAAGDQGSPGIARHLKKMTDTLAHRGPDGEGHWHNEQQTVWLGHRRLAVIDLSAAAAQPLVYRGRYHIVHNGEIYNYPEIRAFLRQKGYHFNTQSDTEVITAAYDYWKENCVLQFDGMFAFAIWDEEEQALFAARDRFGEKPFYYYEDEKHFLFASEMKGLWAAGVEKIPDEKMVLNFLALGHVQNSLDKEQTFYRQIYSLPPAHLLKYIPGQNSLRIHPYWKLNKELRIEISETEATEKFLSLFTASVKRRLRSDVTCGVSLSGGLDSSAVISRIAALRNENNEPGNPLHSFSAVFPGFEKDETAFIDKVCTATGSINHKVRPDVSGLLNEFEKLCYHQEEPFQSSGIYAQYKVFEAARQQGVTVLLDGQGSDEILAGYPRYIHWYLQEVISRHKLGATEREKKLLHRNKYSFRWNIKNIVAAFLPAHAAIQLEKDEYRKIVHHPDIHPDFIRSLRGHEWEGIHKPIVTKLNDILHFNTTEMGLEELLRFADRNSMAHGREVRLPFLNHELVEFIFSLPSQLKMHKGYTKWLLRNAMDKKLPDEIVWRTEKTGFEPPQQAWMQDPLMQDYIQEARRKLVNARMLSAKVLDKKIIPVAAYAPNNADWRYCCAAQFI